ncbi:SIR2 family protein [Microbispora sp. KK1-11]|uniref:SIR2 family NAD-dependent protein deacylase n=1 Tax=Microbispora sp. KK1-11 TaxID=2053005 RepID=UPI0011596401|nr:SIR2 family protein [Microbispora sp. KK1-11]TQS25378.1 SIR2 family protein [Microbispora sp. KK1-11]
METSDWERLITQLRHGDCIPFFGAGAVAGRLPTGHALARELAEKYDYPFGDRHDLSHVVQFATIRYGDSTYVKSALARRLSEVPQQPFDQSNVHSVMAGFPLPLYITTNYDDLVSQALKAAGKDPTVALSPWYTYPGETYPSHDLDPRPARPLVFHLHGSLHDPRSMVLSEDDYLEFLVRLTEDRGAGKSDLIPPAVTRALTQKPLLFLGYSMQDWSFRTLFRGLLQVMPSVLRRRHVSVQLLPYAATEHEQEQARNYLTRYFEGLNTTLFLGTVSEFCEELRNRMAG